MSRETAAIELLHVARERLENAVDVGEMVLWARGRNRVIRAALLHNVPFDVVAREVGVTVEHLAAILETDPDFMR